MKTVRCKYCGKKMSASGIPAHESFRHRLMVLSEFMHNPVVQLEYLITGGVFPEERKMLPAPSPLTVYSTRPLGRMAAPLPWLRRPKGYQLGYGYGRPADLLAAQRWYGKPKY